MSPENNKIQNEVENEFYKNKNYLPEGFNDFGEYEVQKDDGSETLYYILPELINRNIDIDIGYRDILRNIIYNNIDKFILIKKGDKIEINMIDNNSYEIKVGENYYIINTTNNSFIEVGSDIFLEEENIFDLTNEEIEMLINAIKIETNKAEIGIFAGEKDVYTIKVMDFIEWHLPTTAEPRDLMVDIDPNKVVNVAKNVMMSGDINNIDNVDINQLTFSGNEDIDDKTAEKILKEFEGFVIGLIKGEEFKKHKEISSTD